MTEAYLIDLGLLETQYQVIQRGYKLLSEPVIAM